MNAQDSRSVYQNKGRWWEMLLFPMDPNTSWEGTANPPVIIPQSHFLRRYGWIHGDLKKTAALSQPVSLDLAFSSLARGYVLGAEVLRAAALDHRSSVAPYISGRGK